MSFRNKICSSVVGLCILLVSLNIQAVSAGDEFGDRAVKEAQKYRGITLNVTWNKGLMAQEVLLYSGPLWEKLTGIKINVIQQMISEQYPAIQTESLEKSGKYDIYNIVPNRLPDCVRLDALEPLDAYLDRYGYRADLEDISPSFRDNWMSWNGNIYSIPDDGDLIFLYYRRDLFEDPENQKAFKAEYGYELAPPETWKQFDQIAQFFTDKYAPELYGCAMMHDSLSFYFFEELFRINGGRFFDADTMKATINSDIGVATLQEMVDRQKTMPPGAGQWGFMDVLGAFIGGKIAMTEFWPPLGRWSEGYGTDTEQLSWVPKSQIAGKVGYAITPGGYSGLSAGFGLSISAHSRHKEAAYLFIQWLTSRKVSLERVQIPYSLRDPYRVSHFDSTAYRGRWEHAPEYLDLIKNATRGDRGLLDLSLYQINRYELTLTEGLIAAFTGKVDPKTALDTVAASWDRLTRAVGVDEQRKAYKEWSALPN
ncbi:MAG: sugar ABC transporter substrate-binding protein, partial [Desulfobacterales bacterium]|nr:sugar ABC transporter substrate-binding protein [Desulfobacterales bacterium]